MAKPSENTAELERAIQRFVSSFEGVFDNDWERTQICIANPKHLIAPGCTFLEPGVKDESSNWANRGSLLAYYRDLKEVMRKNDLSTDPGDP